MGLLLTTLSMGASASTLFVGSGVGCQYANVQEAVNAAAALPGADSIAIASNLNYTAQQIYIEDTEELSLVGGFDTCVGVPGDEKTLLSGAGGAAAPVIAHRGTAKLKLYNLSLRNGDAVGSGGGLDSRGGGDLHLQDVEFSDNHGTLGGGLYGVGDPGPLGLKVVTLAASVEFSDNTADEGGGLYLVDGRVEPEGEPELLVLRNEASVGDGGGWYLRNASLAVASDGRGFNCSLAFASNRAARYGGGVFLHGRGGSARFTPVAKQDCVAIVSDNMAGVSGGGIHALSQGDAVFATEAGAVLLDVQLASNRAPDGAAAIVRTLAGTGPLTVGFLSLGPDLGSRPTPSRCLDPPVSVCPTMQYNRTETVGGIVSTGATLAAVADAGAPISIEIANAALIGNEGGDVLRIEGADAELNVQDSLIAGSGPIQRVISADGDAMVRLARSTVAYEGFTSGPGAAVILGDRRFTFEGSIASFPSRDFLRMRRLDNVAVVRDILVLDQTLIFNSDFPPAGSTAVHRTNDFGFVAPADGDYRLRGGSPAIDRYFPMLPFDGEPDLDLQRRGYDDQAVPNAAGAVYDLGAYEHGEGLFQNGFE